MRTLLFVLIPLAACTDDGDAASPTLGGDVVGRWRALPNATDSAPAPAPEDRHLVEFKDDGSYTDMYGPDLWTGRYQIDAGDIALTEDGETSTIVLPFRATEDWFVLGALMPSGAADGAAGTWIGSADDGYQRMDLTLALQADATATADYDYEKDDDLHLEGAWRQIGDDVEAIMTYDGIYTVRFKMRLCEGVLGTVYERL